MLDRLRRLHPFQTPDAQRLAILFAVVYFAQGMWSLPTQPITIVLKERGLSSTRISDLFLITTIPWFIKPLYGLISDFVPFLGRRRKSYLLVTSALASAAGLTLGLVGDHSYWRLALFFTAMGLGLAFTDVLVDALMVESGRPRGLTGAFQSVQWAAITTASILVGVVGGRFAELRTLHLPFLLAAGFPLISFTMTLLFVTEPPAPADREAFRATWTAIRGAAQDRTVWVVAGFILFWTFSPSFGPAFLFYQTDTLHFSQQLIGTLASLGAAASVLGALVYAPLSRRMPLQRIINLSIGIGVLGTLSYLAYRDATSAVIIDMLFGCVGMITTLAFLDLAAKSCPRRVEATFFALLMSVYNVGAQLSQNTGARLYDWLGYTPLIFISAGMTALAWFLVPLVRIDDIEAQARGHAEAGRPAASAPSP